MLSDYDTLFTHAVDEQGNDFALAVKHGRIGWRGRSAEAPSAQATMDLGGRLLMPGLVDGHIHLDKSFWGDAWQAHKEAGNIRARLAIEKQALQQAAPMQERARQLLAHVFALGTVALRCHVDVDATTGLHHLQAVQEACAPWQDRVTIEWVAFPQAGVMSSPGTLALLEEALQQGVQVLGGIDPHTLDEDAKGQLDALFDLVCKYQKKIDIHLHEPGIQGIYTLSDIAARTRALGLQGRVTVSHAYALGDVSLEETRKIAQLLAKAGVAIMTNAPGDRAFPPIRLLHEEGVSVFAGNDNIRDAWWPYGNGDMLQRAMLIGYRSGFYTDADLLLALDMVTHMPAKIMGLAHYGLQPGADATFLIVDEPNGAAAVAAATAERVLVHRGQVQPRATRMPAWVNDHGA